MNIFLRPAEPFTLFSYCDFAILIFLNLVFYFLIKYDYIARIKFHKTIIAILFIIVIPFLSNKIEIDNVNRTFSMVDGFNLLYTLFKIPVWWLIGLLNIYILRFFLKKREKNTLRMEMEKRKEKQNQKYKSDFNQLREFVNSFDPVSLIDAGAPENEYDSLTEQILSYIYKQKTKQEMKNMVIGQIENLFGLVIEEKYKESFNNDLNEFIEKLYEHFKIIE